MTLHWNGPIREAKIGHVTVLIGVVSNLTLNLVYKTYRVEINEANHFRETETKSGQDKESKPEGVEPEKPKPDQPEKTVPPLRINLLSLQKRTNGVEPETSRSKKDEGDQKAEAKNSDLEVSFSPDEQPEAEVEKPDEIPEMESDDVDVAADADADADAHADKDEKSELETAQLESDELAKKR